MAAAPRAREGWQSPPEPRSGRDRRAVGTQPGDRRRGHDRRVVTAWACGPTRERERTAHSPNLPTHSAPTFSQTGGAAAASLSTRLHVLPPTAIAVPELGGQDERRWKLATSRRNRGGSTFREKLRARTQSRISRKNQVRGIRGRIRNTALGGWGGEEVRGEGTGWTAGSPKRLKQSIRLARSRRHFVPR